MGNIESHWINGALVAAAAIAVSYWFTWSSDRDEQSTRKLLIMGLITFVAAFGADLLGDEIIEWLD